ncbi:hypothetical protein D3C73_1582030 [compost metagenome]
MSVSLQNDARERPAAMSAQIILAIYVFSIHSAKLCCHIAPISKRFSLSNDMLYSPQNDKGEFRDH